MGARRRGGRRRGEERAARGAAWGGGGLQEGSLGPWELLWSVLLRSVRA
jgi:hypothetical protein